MKEKIAQLIEMAIGRLQETGVFPSFDMPTIEVVRPKDDQFGDYTSSIALALSRSAKKNPMELAEMISQQITNSKEQGVGNNEQKDIFQKIEVVAPGYINFTFSRTYLSDVMKDILKKGSEYGAFPIGKGERVNNEFISANPTGPLHLGNGRGGFLGDSLSRILRKMGYDVTNEYYVNDAGVQTLKLAHSLFDDDEAVYSGQYIEELRTLPELKKLLEDKATYSTVGINASDVIISDYIWPTIEKKMRIHFDSRISERKDIIGRGYVDKALVILKEKGLTFEQEGALWLRTTDFGDDKDRVLVKSDGSRTYFASDAGYLLHKMERGFSRLILTLGADHHGYKMRLLAVAQALGFAGRFDFVFVQLVRLMKDGEEVRMSKRAGNVVTIDELVELVGADVARFFFLMYAADTHMNFDLGLAEERSQKNPVFYVQYAHARIASVLRKANEEGLTANIEHAELLMTESERALLRELEKFPELLELIATEYSVHRLPQYAIRLAEKFHSFYNECVVVDTEKKGQSEARLALITATKIILGETLALLGVDAPEKM